MKSYIKINSEIELSDILSTYYHSISNELCLLVSPNIIENKQKFKLLHSITTDIISTTQDDCFSLYELFIESKKNNSTDGCVFSNTSVLVRDYIFNYININKDTEVYTLYEIDYTLIKNKFSALNMIFGISDEGEFEIYNTNLLFINNNELINKYIDLVQNKILSVDISAINKDVLNLYLTDYLISYIIYTNKLICTSIISDSVLLYSPIGYTKSIDNYFIFNDSRDKYKLDIISEISHLSKIRSFNKDLDTAFNLNIKADLLSTKNQKLKELLYEYF